MSEVGGASSWDIFWARTRVRTHGLVVEWNFATSVRGSRFHCPLCFVAMFPPNDAE